MAVVHRRRGGRGLFDLTHPTVPEEITVVAAQGR
jgi:hypothetical protein